MLELPVAPDDVARLAGPDEVRAVEEPADRTERIEAVGPDTQKMDAIQDTPASAPAKGASRPSTPRSPARGKPRSRGGR